MSTIIAEDSAEVLMSNYNEVLDAEKRALSVLVENSFYPQETINPAKPQGEAEVILQMLDSNPALSKQILQTLLSGVVHAQ